MTKTWLILGLVTGSLAAACGGSQKPAEDQSDANSASEKTKEAAKDAGEATEKATEEAGEKIEDAGDKVKEKTKDEN